MANPTITTQVLTCPCCGGGGDCDCDCCPDGYWTEYELIAAGVTFFGTVPPCDSCVFTRASAINGTFRLKKRPFCFWYTDELSGNQPGCDLPEDHPKWNLFCDGTYWYLTDDIHTFALYRASATDFTCLDGGTFGLDPAYVADGCVSYPATMTLTPAGVWVPCEGDASNFMPDGYLPDGYVPTGVFP